VESNHHSTKRQGYSLLSSPLLSVRVSKGGRPGSNRRRRDSQPRVLPSTPQPPRKGHHEAGTTGLEPATSRLTSECSAQLSYAPELARTSAGQSFNGAGGIRTHGLELMRLARTAAPLPRCGCENRSGWQESNLRSPVPETGGVAYSPTASSRSASTPGGTRTRSFRVEGPASSPLRPRGQELRRQGSNLRSRG
jgi:hypothetical protein